MNNRDKYDLYNDILEEKLYNCDITKYGELDMILDVDDSLLQFGQMWRAHKEYGSTELFSQAGLYIYPDKDNNMFCFAIMNMEPDYKDFEYRFEIPANLSHAELKEKLFEEMSKAEDKWDEYCDETDAEQEEEKNIEDIVYYLKHNKLNSDDRFGSTIDINVVISNENEDGEEEIDELFQPYIEDEKVSDELIKIINENTPYEFVDYDPVDVYLIRLKLKDEHIKKNAEEFADEIIDNTYEAIVDGEAPEEITYEEKKYEGYEDALDEIFNERGYEHDGGYWDIHCNYKIKYVKKEK